MGKIIDQGRYIPRLIDETVDRYLSSIGAVCIRREHMRINLRIENS